MVVAGILALALALPTGALFGIGYGTGVRIGYEQIYPLLFPANAKGERNTTSTVQNVKAINQIYDAIGGKEASQMGIATGLASAMGELDKNPDFQDLLKLESTLSGSTSSNSVRTRFGLDNISQSGDSFSEEALRLQALLDKEREASTGSPDVQEDLNKEFRDTIATYNKQQLIFLVGASTLTVTEKMIVKTRLRLFFDYTIPSGIKTKVTEPENIVVQRGVTALQQKVFNNWMRQRSDDIRNAYNKRTEIRKMIDKTSSQYKFAVGTYNSNKASFYNTIGRRRNDSNYLIRIEAGRMYKTRPYPRL